MKYPAIVIIYNPNSTGPSQDMAKELKAQLRRLYPDTTLKLAPTKHAGHAEKLANQAAREYKKPLIISVSGDGGYNEVVNGAMKASAKGINPICAVLPAGNANDHSRTVQQRPLIELIKAGEVHRFDLLKATISEGSHTYTRYAHSYIGLGITPVVAVELNKTTLNAVKEIWIVLKTFYKFRPFKLRINGNVIKLDSVIFANIRQMAKILTLAETAKIDDGRFEVITLPHANRSVLIRLFTKAAFKGLKPKKYRNYKFTVIKKMPAQFDGEVIYLQAGSNIAITADRQVMKSIY